MLRLFLVATWCAVVQGLFSGAVVHRPPFANTGAELPARDHWAGTGGVVLQTEAVAGQPIAGIVGRYVFGNDVGTVTIAQNATVAAETTASLRTGRRGALWVSARLGTSTPLTPGPVTVAAALSGCLVATAQVALPAVVPATVAVRLHTNATCAVNLGPSSCGGTKARLEVGLGPGAMADDLDVALLTQPAAEVGALLLALPSPADLRDTPALWRCFWAEQRGAVEAAGGLLSGAAAWQTVGPFTAPTLGLVAAGNAVLTLGAANCSDGVALLARFLGAAGDTVGAASAVCTESVSSLTVRVPSTAASATVGFDATTGSLGTLRCQLTVAPSSTGTASLTSTRTASVTVETDPTHTADSNSTSVSATATTTRTAVRSASPTLGLNHKPTFRVGNTSLTVGAAATVVPWVVASDDGDGGTQRLRFEFAPVHDAAAHFDLLPGVDYRGQLYCVPKASSLGAAAAFWVTLHDDGPASCNPGLQRCPCLGGDCSASLAVHLELTFVAPTAPSAAPTAAPEVDGSSSAAGIAALVPVLACVMSCLVGLL